MSKAVIRMARKAGTREAPEGLIEGDCRDVLPRLPAASVDFVFADPPFPCISRDYGYWSESEWHYLMDRVVPECRRVLKPTGSAVFLLQPNSLRAGRMRTWHLEFALKWAREWGWVQDAYALDVCALPVGGACRAGLMRGALKWAVWLGGEGCYRDQRAVLLEESQGNKLARVAARRLARGQDRAGAAKTTRRTPNGVPVTDDPARLKEAAGRRGGTTPFNVLALARGRNPGGHPAATPLELARWWVRYACPPGGLVLDPFGGSGTTGRAAAMEGRRALLIEKEAGYCEMIRGGKVLCESKEAA